VSRRLVRAIAIAVSALVVLFAAYLVLIAVIFAATPG
jgi:hypothetical protein